MSHMGNTDDPDMIVQAFVNAGSRIKSGEMGTFDGGGISIDKTWAHTIRAATREGSFIELDIAEQYRRYYTVSKKNHTVEDSTISPIQSKLG